MTTTTKEAPLSNGNSKLTGGNLQNHFHASQPSFQNSNGRSRFEFESRKTVCPCREHSNFTPLKNHSTGGKCWSCDKFFPPSKVQEDNYVHLNENKSSNIKKNQSLTFVRSHIYWTPDGNNYLLKVDIYRNAEGKKSCFQYRWEGVLVWEADGFFREVGAWVKGLSGVKLTLYDTPLLLMLQQCSETDKDKTLVFIVEGEKDCNTLKNKGYIATCNPLGAGKWKNEFNELLRGLVCCVVPDNDVPGLKHGQQIEESLRGVAKRTCILHLTELMPDLPPKADITDFIELGGVL